MNKKNNVQHLISETNNISISDRVVPEIEMTKVPLRAMIYSAILPGAGQFYNESYWKIPVIGALGGYFVYGIVNNNNKANDFGEKYVRSQTSSNPEGDPTLKASRDFYNSQRDNFIIYLSITYLVNIIDAYVDAHLYDFDVSDDSSVKLNPGFGKINFSVSF